MDDSGPAGPDVGRFYFIRGISMTRYFTILLAALAPTFVISDAVAQEDNAIVDRHIAAAARAAKADLLGPLTFCKYATADPPSRAVDKYGTLVKEPPLEPMQVMDELYFVGNYWTSAWAVKTSEGIVLIEALDNPDEVQHYIEDGLKKLKLDPADIKYVIVSHAHGDHYGGASYLNKKFNAKIVMSDIDWRALENPNFEKPAVRRAAETRHGGQ